MNIPISSSRPKMTESHFKELNMKLYELSSQFNEFLQLAESEEFDTQVVADTLESITAEIQEKGRNVAAYSQNIDADIQAMKEAEQRIVSRRKTLERKLEWMKDYLRNNMERCGISKIECPEFKVSLSKPSEICEVYDEDALPPDYVVTKTTKAPDKKLIMKALKDGFEVEGAKIGKGKSRLTIK